MFQFVQLRGDTKPNNIISPTLYFIKELSWVSEIGGKIMVIS